MWLVDFLAGLRVGVDEWTVLGSVAAVAAVFIGVLQLRSSRHRSAAHPSQREAEQAPHARGETSTRISDGTTLVQLLDGGGEPVFENDPPLSLNDAARVGELLQMICDVARDVPNLDPAGRVRKEFELTTKLQQLERAGWIVTLRAERRIVSANGRSRARAATVVRVARTA